MGDAAQESGETRIQFTTFFCAVHRSEAGSDSGEAVERGATVVKDCSSEAMERRLRCTGELRVTGWRPLSTMGDAAQESGEPRLPFTTCFFLCCT